MALFVGLMSGTSLDGVDAVLADFTAAGQGVRTIAHLHVVLADADRESLLQLNRPGDDELHRAALAANAVARAYAVATLMLLDNAGCSPKAVTAIGAHGQTVRHRPREFDGTGYTLQLLNGALLAEISGIDVVCDFRSRDVAAGGEGAPLVPAFHAERLSEPGRDIAVLNIGGMANLTLLAADGRVSGFDCGPGNVLMDHWCRTHFGRPYDAGGAFAASGRPDDALLAAMQAEPYFQRAPPKSTGRDLFNAQWLADRLAACSHPATTSAADVMATLAQLTAQSALDALRRHAPKTERLLVCGGGAFNAHLMGLLASSAAPALEVASTATRGVAPDQVEALAFAWLAAAFFSRKPGNSMAATGARGPRVLGALYPF